jgi:ribonuclease HI
LIPNQAPLELSGYDPATTNNRMELTAVIEGLKPLPDRAGTVTVHTDSQLVVKGMTEWIAGWQRKQWRKSDGDPVLNAELWRALLAQSQRFEQIRWQWVRGHSGVPLNERADQLAVAAIERRGGMQSTSEQASLPVQQPIQAEFVRPSQLELSELNLLRELEQRVRRAVGPHRGQVPVYDEVLGKLDALRESAIVANPSKTKSSRS